MKNSFKVAFLALAIAVSAVACKGKSATEGTDTTKTDTVAVDTAAKDTAAVDTAKKDTVAVDTTKK